MSRIIWLASYPKSGNTWLRAFLTNYLANANSPADINALNVGRIASARLFFEDFVGVEASDLTFDQIEACRPSMYRLLAEQSKETLFLKVHDAYTFTCDGEALFPANVTQGVLYIVRHPCDVTVSIAHYSGLTLDKVISLMNDPTHALEARESALDLQLRQKLLTWSGHVFSWLESGLEIQVIRYEDMLAHPIETFSAVIRFVHLPFEVGNLKRAITFSHFAELEAQEQKGNFKERSPRAQKFFRQGKADAWHGVLPDSVAARLVKAHGDAMRRFGYLDAEGNIL